MRPNLLSLAMVVLMLLSNVYAQDLNYGDVIHLQNKWSGNYSGGFLDTRGYQRDFEKTGNFLCVSTATSQNRDNGSGSWKVISASGKAEGTPVLVGDQVHLQNQWNYGKGGYLDTRGYQRDFEKTGNHLCVSTANSSNRDKGSGTWRVTVLKNTLYQGQTLKINQKMVSANQKYMAVMQADGNFCVYKYDKGRQGAFVWGSYQTNVKYKLGANYHLIMQKDGNLCIYNRSKQFQWGSYQVKKYSLTAGCKLVLTNEGKLNILNEKGSTVWSS